MNASLFPPNPTHGMLFELKSGLLFKYDATILAWIKLATAGLNVPLATDERDGAMSAIDFKKLNRLVLPPPLATITGTDCVAPFKSGAIGLYAGDRFIGVDGTVKLQNIDNRGDRVSTDTPFKIHQHTYGFDFTLDVPELVNELKSRRQFNATGRKGDPGQIGSAGDPGPNFILSGPPGETGDEGTAPPCQLQIGPDDLQVEPHEGVTKALVAGRVVVDPTDPTKYKLVFDRQTIGPIGFGATKFHVQSDTSSWVLAVTGDQPDSPVDNSRSEAACGHAYVSGRNQAVYYIDLESIIDVIHEQYLTQARLIKNGYQDVVKFWINTMSDVFDEQKAALCCALENCMSVRKNIAIREHMENVAASAAGSARILLHGRNSDEAVNLSSTRGLRQVGGPDLCEGGGKFPLYPNQSGSGGFAGDEREAETQQAESQSLSEAVATIDPLVNSNSASAVVLTLEAGSYNGLLTRADARVNGKYRSNPKIQYIKNGQAKVVQFLDKGEFDGLLEAKSAYEGLGLRFDHDGGPVSIWLPNINPQQVSGSVDVHLRADKVVGQEEPAPTPQEAKEAVPEVEEAQEAQEAIQVATDCHLPADRINWYRVGWEAGACCGLVVNLMGQDYIIVKRSIGDELCCGGGESLDSPCIGQFAMSDQHPAFAWPTLDGVNFTPIPSHGSTFRLDADLNKAVARKIVNGEFESGKGSPPGVRHLAYQLATVLFPVH